MTIKILPYEFRDSFCVTKHLINLQSIPKLQWHFGYIQALAGDQFQPALGNRRLPWLFSETEVFSEYCAECLLQASCCALGAPESDHATDYSSYERMSSACPLTCS